MSVIIFLVCSLVCICFIKKYKVLSEKLTEAGSRISNLEIVSDNGVSNAGNSYLSNDQSYHKSNNSDYDLANQSNVVGINSLKSELKKRLKREISSTSTFSTSSKASNSGRYRIRRKAIKRRKR